MIGLVLAREAMPMPRGCDPMRIVSHMWSPGTDTSPVSRRINLSADDDLIHHQQGINVSGHGWAPTALVNRFFELVRTCY